MATKSSEATLAARREVPVPVPVPVLLPVLRGLVGWLVGWLVVGCWSLVVGNFLLWVFVSVFFFHFVVVFCFVGVLFVLVLEHARARTESAEPISWTSLPSSCSPAA